MSSDFVHKRTIQAESLPFAVAAASAPSPNHAYLQEQRVKVELFKAGMFDPKDDVLLLPLTQPGIINE